MIYPSNFEQKIDFDQIRKLIDAECVSEMGRFYVSKMRFSSQPRIISRMLDQTMEFIHMLQTGQSFPAIQCIDLREELSQLAPAGSYIQQEALFNLTEALRILDEIIILLKGKEEDELTELKLLASEIIFPKEVYETALKIIDTKGNIRDNASEKLGEIRQKLRAKQNELMRETRKAFLFAKESGWVPEQAEMTVRNGRTVIPIKSSDKRAFKGFIQDESATGQTVFMEPLGSFEVNNEIIELESEERREIIRILTRFTNMLRPYLEEVKAIYRFLGLIDFILAKAKFSVKINASKPVISENQNLSLRRAIHPLLFLSHKNSGKEVIPLDLELHPKQRILMISGPNAGGKSVCLKTTGLLQYMLQCGIPVPASPDSEFFILENIFIDIGDEQSLENDLSTYSSHLMNMKHFLRHANEKSLVLIDEFGTGTEPQLGGAIAEAALEQFEKKGAFGVITTHYSNLKLAAERMENLVNGAMLFDVKELRPLYILKIGQPGSSFAFEIAHKTGFPSYVLNRAKKKSGIKHLRFDQQLQELETEKLNIAQKQSALDSEKKQLNDLKEKYEQLSAEIESNKKLLLEKAREEALQIIRNANKEVEKTIREIKESQAEKEKTKLSRENLEQARLALEAAKKKKQENKPKKENRKFTSDIKSEVKQTPTEDLTPPKPGDNVSIKGSEIVGTLIEIVGEEGFVNVNDIRLKIAIKNLLRTDKKPKLIQRRATIPNIKNDINKKAEEFHLSLDLRGKRADETLEILSRYIDDAILLSAKEISILHGKGNGILRDVVRDYLKTIEQVKEFGDAPITLGGAGITRVVFR
ncbi:MAG: Smr/MutS family protein [Bacteroidales bacterium]|nr:Smr/MutS family protein [Bacteroidales bacterium]